MPKFEVARSYVVTAATTIEADSEQHAEEIALYDGDVYWKEYDGEYLKDITVEQVDA